MSLSSLLWDMGAIFISLAFGYAFIFPKSEDAVSSIWFLFFIGIVMMGIAIGLSIREENKAKIREDKRDEILNRIANILEAKNGNETKPKV